MNITIKETGGLSELTLTGRGIAASLPSLEHVCQAEAANGASGILVDLSQVSGWTKGGLAALVDLTSRWPHAAGGCAPALGLCGLDAAAVSKLANAGLDRVMPLFDSLAAARAATPFRRMQLAGMSAVIHCDAGPEAGPLGEVTPLALLDVLGRPVLGRLFDHLSHFGITHSVLASTPGETKSNLVKVCGSGAGNGLARQSGIAAFHTGAGECVAKTIASVQADHGAFDADTVVISSPSVTDMDLAALVDHHRNAGAEATLAMAAGPDGQMQPSGIAVLTPAAVVALQERGITDARRTRRGPTELGAALTRAGVRCATWATSARCIAPRSPHSYMALLSAVLQDRMPGQTPVGERLMGGLWMAPGADLGPRTRIEGPCWIGPAAQVARGASLSGPAIVGAGARVAAKSFLRNGMLWAGAEMQAGALVDGMIAAGDWAVSHRVLGDQPLVDMPLDQVAGARTRPILEKTGMVSDLIARATA